MKQYDFVYIINVTYENVKSYNYVQIICIKYLILYNGLTKKKPHKKLLRKNVNVKYTQFPNLLVQNNPRRVGLPWKSIS